MALKSSLSWTFLTDARLKPSFPWGLGHRLGALQGGFVQLGRRFCCGARHDRRRRWRRGACCVYCSGPPGNPDPVGSAVCSRRLFPTDSWWMRRGRSLPLQIAIFAALNAHVRYVRTGRFRHAIAAACWLVFGMIFSEKSAAIPLLLFAVTAGFLVKQPLRSAIWRTVVRFWRAWLLYLALLAGYGATLVIALRTDKQLAAPPSSARAVFTFARELIGQNFLPGAFGGPWNWFPSSDSTYAYAAPSAFLAWAATFVAAAVVLGSVLTRRESLARLDHPGCLDSARRYGASADQYGSVMLATPRFSVLICIIWLTLPRLCQSWWVWLSGPPPSPSSGPDTAGPQRVFFRGPWKVIATAVMGAFVVSSVWSVQNFQHVTSSAFSREYLANAIKAADAPNGTVIFSRLVAWPDHASHLPQLCQHGCRTRAVAESAQGDWHELESVGDRRPSHGLRR